MLMLTSFQVGASGESTSGVYFPPEERIVLEEKVFAAACYMAKLDCDYIPQPVVVYSERPEAEKLWGYYSTGTAYVVINEKIKGTPFSLTVLAHEYTHYLQFVQRKYPYTDSKSEEHAIECANEREAHDAGHRLAVAIKLENDPRVSTWDENKSKYGCEK